MAPTRSPSEPDSPPNNSPYFLPHPAFAEDQPYAKSILTTHVLYRGFQAGALVGSLIGAGLYAYRGVRPAASKAAPLSSPSSKAAPSSSPPPKAASASNPASTSPTRLLLQTILRSSGRGTLYATPLLGLALFFRMRNRSEIEWQDRAWRLLENEGQKSVDRWSGAGLVAGGVAAAATATATVTSGSGALLVLGGMGVGSLLGSGGSVLWRGA